LDKTIKNTRIQVLLLKICLLIALSWLFYKQFAKISRNEIASFSVTQPISLIAAILLVFANWGFEWFKWREILRMSDISSSLEVRVKSFLAGIITGLLTPNMLGNFIGRMFWFRRRDRPALILLTLFSNAAQFLASVIFGLLAIAWLGIRDLGIPWSRDKFLFFTGIGLLALTLLYLFIEKIPLAIIRSNKWMDRLLPWMQKARFFRSKLLLFSLLRHGVFSLQYWLLLQAFGLDVELAWFGWIWQVFFWTTLIPSLWFGKLVIRESMALWILGPLTGNPGVVLFTSVFLWAINQGIPAAIGIPYFRKNKIHTP
jgi:hypothetical protein